MLHLAAIPSFRIRLALFVATLTFAPGSVRSDTFAIARTPNVSGATMPEESVIGEVRYAAASRDDTLLDIARRNDLGHDEIVLANPQLDRWVPGAGSRVVLPSKHVLPDAPHEGLVLNIAELRLYYFPPVRDSAEAVVMTFPVSIGRIDWNTPLGRTTVVRKEKDPDWHPPPTIRAEHAAEGEPLPEVIRGGDPNNPLGRFALYLAISGYLIHGTDERKSAGIGMHVTHGCVRMYPEDIEWLYRFVEKGTSVTIVNQPVKVGWKNGSLFLEVHVPLDEVPGIEPQEPEALLAQSRELIARAAHRFDRVDFVRLDEGAIERAVEVANGVPVLVGSFAALPPARSSNVQKTN